MFLGSWAPSWGANGAVAGGGAAGKICPPSAKICPSQIWPQANFPASSAGLNITLCLVCVRYAVIMILISEYYGVFSEDTRGATRKHRAQPE